MMGEAGRTSRSPVTPTPTVVVIEISVIAAAAPTTASIAGVIVIVGVVPGWSWVDGLHGDL